MTEDEKRKRYEELVKKAEADVVKAGGFIEFDGQNCDIDCPGWDGVSRRCECGNRRVYWELNDDECTSVSAVAW